MKLERKNFWIVTAFLIGSAIGGLSGGLINNVSAQSNSTVYSCVKNSNGSIRIVAQGVVCSSSESPLSWSIGGSGGGGLGLPFICQGCFLGAPYYGPDLLTGKDLSNANLLAANINDANLTGVNLSNAKTKGIRLQNTNLTNANLTNTSMVGADLRGADLTTANLTGVTWGDTQCPDHTYSDSNNPAAPTCIGHLTPIIPYVP